MLYAVIAAVIGFLSAAVLLIWLVHVKSDIERINTDLSQIIKTETNKKLTSLSFDRDVCVLENAINDLLVKQKQLIVEQKRLDNELKAMITNISHDLRTPLTAINGYIKMLKNENLSKEKREKYFDVSEKKLAVLTLLIEELFEFATILERSKKEDLARINCMAMLRESLSLFYEDYIGKNFIVGVDICESPVYLICSKNNLSRIFQNILKNILIHGKSNVKISGGLNGKLTFENDIINNDFDVDRVFERFYTADSSRNQKSTGLGLVIAKTLTEDIGGTITASKADNVLKIEIDFSTAICK